MDQEVRQFISRVIALNKRQGGLAVGIRGSTTHRDSIMLDLVRSATDLLQTSKDGSVEQQLNEVESKLNVAQATNAIGYTDLTELVGLLDNIRKGLK
jgi:hypothetical protein